MPVRKCSSRSRRVPSRWRWYPCALAIAAICAGGSAGDAIARGVLAVGSDADATKAAEVIVYDGGNFSILLDGAPFFSYTGGARVALGDVDANGRPDVVTGSGTNASSTILAFDDSSGTFIYGFGAFDAAFTGGVYVATGDVDGDGHADIVVGAGAGGSPVVAVFSGTDHTLLAKFFAYDAGMASGVRVATGDVNGDGHADIIVAPGPGSSPVVRVFDGVSGLKIDEFYAYAPAATNGVFVAAADVNGDGRADIVTGADAGGAPIVNVFDGASHALLQSFVAYPANFAGGVRVAAGDVDGSGKPSIATATGPGVPVEIKVFDWPSLAVPRDIFPFSTFSGGAFIAVPYPDDVIFADRFGH
jgi:hypothetical protein